MINVSRTSCLSASSSIVSGVMPCCNIIRRLRSTATSISADVTSSPLTVATFATGVRKVVMDPRPKNAKAIMIKPIIIFVVMPWLRSRILMIDI